MEKPAYWAQTKIFINGSAQRRLMIVLRTPPCQKALKEKKCFICGFETHSLGVKNPNYNLVSQFIFLKNLIKKNKIKHIDILSSGSILDPKQINYNQVLRLMTEIRKLNPLKNVLIEGRVEYCSKKKLQRIKQILNNIKLEYGIGLESYSNYVRNKVLKKKLKLKDYINCLKKLTKINIGVCTYLLIGIPRLSLHQSLEDTKTSILKVVDLYKKYHCQGRIALFPIFIAPNTPLESLYNQKKYKLINLSDIMKVLLEIKEKIDFKKYPIFIGLDDEKISQGRYLWSRNKKGEEILKKIKKFNCTQEL
jgi:radical SAM enzyme (TIGR01210 family)